jgi:hypothetical protein
VPTYQDFEIRFERQLGDGDFRYTFDSPAGHGTGVLRLAALGDSWDLADLALQVRAAIMPKPPGDRDIARSLLPRPRQAQEIGAALFQALFSDQSVRLFEQSRGLVRAQADGGLRIKLRLDPEVAGQMALGRLPWELLYDPAARQYLAGGNRRTTVVRFLEAPQPTVLPPFEPPLRVLVARAQPPGLSRLDLATETELIVKSWAQVRGTAVNVLDGMTLSSLRDEVLRGRPHVLHFMGHGTFVAGQNAGALLLAAGDGGAAQAVSGRTLAPHLADLELRLVVLNSCQSARLPEGMQPDAFAGVAAALVLSGIPAVVAMQFPISDTAAHAFSRAFYRRLAGGDPVDTALGEARREISAVSTAALEWATPVLYMRTPDGRLFDTPPPRRTAHRSLALLCLVCQSIAWCATALLTALVTGIASLASQADRPRLTVLAAIATIAALLGAATDRALGEPPPIPRFAIRLLALLVGAAFLAALLLFALPQGDS